MIGVRVSYEADNKFRCPECERERFCLKKADNRRWRHLNACPFPTSLYGQAPRIDCNELGVMTASVPKAELHARFPTCSMTMSSPRLAHEKLDGLDLPSLVETQPQPAVLMDLVHARWAPATSGCQSGP